MNEVFANLIVFAQNNESARYFPILIVTIFFLFYFIVLRPDRKKRNETDRMLKELKKNDRVVTIGGIFGTVVNAEKEAAEVTIKVDENANTKIRILRSAIRDVIKNEAVGDTKKPAPAEKQK